MSSKQVLLTKDFEKTVDNITTKNSPTKSILYFLFSAFILGINTLHIKLTSKFWPNAFSPNSFMTYRSFCVLVISIYLAKKYDITVKPIKDIKNKFWFFQRTCGNYFSMISFIYCVFYLRAATAAVFSSMYPPLVLIFSIFILKEKFHIRYIFGLILCICGAFIIILNERGVAVKVEEVLSTESDLIEAVGPDAPHTADLDYLNFIKGIMSGLFHVILVSLNIVANKIISKEITHVEQCFYLGCTNICLGLTDMFLFSKRVAFDPFYAICAFFNGLLFYSATYFMNESFKGIELSKLTPMSYFNTLTVFFLGVIFLGESLFISDIIGSICIISFNIYNAFVPLK
jgi:drug/metabolite transporter (DMT)-like permease